MAAVTCEVCSTLNHVSPTTRDVKICTFCAAELPPPERPEKQLRLPQRTTDTF